MAANPFLVVGIHHCFGGGTNSDVFFKFVLTSLGNPGDLWRETLNVVLFLLEDAFRDEHGEVGVFNTQFLDFRIEPVWESVRSQKRIYE